MTKRMMKDALLELMQERDLVSISVTAICEAADVNRSTFYNYYTDPSDLLREAEQDFLDRIPTPPDVLDKQNQQTLLCNGYVPVSEDNDELTAGFKRLYIANGTVGMLREWVNEDCPVSSEKLAEMMYSLSRRISDI